jgi:hypothetical protein
MATIADGLRFAKLAGWTPANGGGSDGAAWSRFGATLNAYSEEDDP